MSDNALSPLSNKLHTGNNLSELKNLKQEMSLETLLEQGGLLGILKDFTNVCETLIDDVEQGAQETITHFEDIKRRLALDHDEDPEGLITRVGPFNPIANKIQATAETEIDKGIDLIKKYINGPDSIINRMKRVIQTLKKSLDDPKLIRHASSKIPYLQQQMHTEISKIKTGIDLVKIDIEAMQGGDATERENYPIVGNDVKRINAAVEETKQEITKIFEVILNNFVGTNEHHTREELKGFFEETEDHLLDFGYIDETLQSMTSDIAQSAITPLTSLQESLPSHA